VLFNSYIFLFIFFPIVIFFFFFFNLSKKKIFIFLSIFSVIFYSYDNYNLTILFLISIAVNYYFSILIDSKKNLLQKKKYLISIICVNILILLYFKYYNFFVKTLLNILDINIKNLEIYLPLAISFYTFQQISFQIDNYKKKQKKNFLQYLLYLFFFPQLIAGPIIRYSYFIKESLKKNFSRISAKNLTIGISIVIIGLSKKIIFADPAGAYVDQVYNKISNGELIAGVDYFFFIILFSIQIYYDFSGYSDIAVGTGKILNFSIPINFNSPYKSKSIIEFWKKWHITLSQFFRDYLYIYFGGNKNGILYQSFIIVLIMSIVGLWHGASNNFIVWGFLHGIYISTNHILKKIDYKIYIPDFCKIIFTFLLVSIAFVFFRVDSFENSLKILMGSLNFTHYFTNSYLMNNISLLQKLIYILSLICVFYFPNVFQIFKLKLPNIKGLNNFGLVIRFKSNYIWLLYLFILSVFLLANLANPQTFIYFRF
jgi:D-alanyl-lipoteichoic acid acyltransferase DltB (MBOAT superfamily)